MKRFAFLFALVLSIVAYGQSTTQPAQVPEKVGVNQPEPNVEKEQKAPFSVDGGIDVVTAYWFRGYKTVNSVSFQPSAKVSLAPISVKDISLTPYLGTWNNLSTQPGPKPPRGWNESDVNAGVQVAYKNLTVDIGYNLYAYPDGFSKSSQEFGATFTYDDSGDGYNLVGVQKGSLLPFALTPHFAVFHEVSDNADGSLDTYLEVGISPQLQCPKFDKLTVTVPVTLGMSGGGYYRNAAGHDSFFGYVTVGVDAKYQFNDNWYIHGGVAYTNLLASGTREGNGGNPNVVVGTVGVGFSF